MQACRSVVLVTVLVGCNGSGGPTDSEEVVLRVSASHGMDGLVPGPELSGVAAYLLPLVYVPRDGEVRVGSLEGNEVTLVLEEGATRSSTQLADSLQFRGLASARAEEGGQIRARFTSAARARAFVSWELGTFALGPFEVTEQESRRLRLEAREEEQPIDVIAVIAVEEEQQWRRLLARDVDVVPLTDATRIRRLEDVGSIRVLTYPPQSDYGVIFQTASPKLRDPAVRRAIVGAIAPKAVARTACGSAECASDDLGPVPAGDPERLPDEMKILALETDNVAVRAAQVLRHQLRQREVAVEIETAPPAAGFGRISRGDYEIVVSPLPKRLDGRLLEVLGNFGFEMKELTSAIESGDDEAAREILAREVPFVPLFEARYFAGVDSRFCGGEPESYTSWRWLADLYPCEAGE